MGSLSKIAQVLFDGGEPYEEMHKFACRFSGRTNKVGKDFADVVASTQFADGKLHPCVVRFAIFGEHRCG